MRPSRRPQPVDCQGRVFEHGALRKHRPSRAAPVRATRCGRRASSGRRPVARDGRGRSRSAGCAVWTRPADGRRRRSNGCAHGRCRQRGPAWADEVEFNRIAAAPARRAPDRQQARQVLAPKCNGRESHGCSPHASRSRGVPRFAQTRLQWKSLDVVANRPSSGDRSSSRAAIRLRTSPSRCQVPYTASSRERSNSLRWRSRTLFQTIT